MVTGLALHGENPSDAELVAAGDALVSAAPRRAAELFGRARDIAAARGAWSHAVAAAEREVRAWGKAGNWTEAEAAANRAFEWIDAVGDPVTRLAHRSNIAVGLMNAGATKHAAALLDDVILDARELPVDDAEAQRVLAAALVNRATLIVDGRDDGPADSWLEEAEDIATTLGDSVRLGTILVNQAVLCSRRQDVAGARVRYARAAAAYRAAGAPVTDEAAAVRGEAATLADAGRLQEALERYEEAGALFSAAHDEGERRLTEVGAVMARHSVGERIAPAELSEMEGWLPDMPPGEAAKLSMNLANIAHENGDEATARRLRRRAKRLFKAIGSVADAARVDLGRAVSLRREGRLEQARRVLRDARRTLEREGRWRNVAHADHNLALVLEGFANRSQPPDARLLSQAADRSISALAALDRHRHRLPTAADRRALGETTYPGMFALALRLALLTGRRELAAAVVERARVQPVLADPRDPARLVDPAPVAARRGAHAIAGRGRRVYLSAEARRVAGNGAHWVGWWTDGRGIVRADSCTGGVRVAAQQVDVDAMARLEAAGVAVRGKDLEAAEGDRGVAARLALWRAAQGPLLNDSVLAGLIADELPKRAVDRCRGDNVVASLNGMTAAELLWPLARTLLGEELLSELAPGRLSGSRKRLAIGAPAALGRVPWAALPVSDPRSADRPVALVEVADLVAAVPASLSAALRAGTRAEDGHGALVIADPTGDLPFARRLAQVGRSLPDAVVLEGRREAHRPRVLEALTRRPDTMVVASHIRPGTADDPASSAIVVAGEGGKQETVSASELATVAAPPTCLLVGCDASGWATGAELAGVATGLLWAGASWVVSATTPTVEDRLAPMLDAALVQAVVEEGAPRGLWRWQRHRAERWAYAPDQSENAPARWASFVAMGSGVCPQDRAPVSAQRSSVSPGSGARKP